MSLASRSRGSVLFLPSHAGRVSDQKADVRRLHVAVEDARAVGRLQALRAICRARPQNAAGRARPVRRDAGRQDAPAK